MSAHSCKTAFSDTRCPPVSAAEGQLLVNPATLQGPEALPIFNERLHDQWTEWLSSFDWQWFVTFTFKEAIHPEAADKLYRVWINKLNRAIYGPKWSKRPEEKGVKHVRALEWQKRGVLHYHALVANTGIETRERWATEWQKLAEDSKAGFIKIDQYDEQKGGAAAYLSKYVTKGGQIDCSPNMHATPFNPTVAHHEIRELQKRF